MPKVTETGMKNHRVARSHHDINGKWGGYLAWVVHYQPDNENENERMEMYCHVGNYWDVGKWAHGPHISKMDVFFALRELLNGSMSMREMIKFMQMVRTYRKYRKCPR